MTNKDSDLKFRVAYFILQTIVFAIGISGIAGAIYLMLHTKVFAVGFLGGLAMLAIGGYGLYVGLVSVFGRKK